MAVAANTSVGNTFWSEHRRRQFCRLGFLLCAAIPTLFVAYTIIVPDRHAQFQTELATTLGLDIELGQVTPLTPHRTKITSLHGFDPHVGSLLKLDQLIVTRQADQTLLHVNRAEIQIDSLHQLLEPLTWRLERWLHDSSTPTQIIIDQLTLVDGNSAEPHRQTFDRVHLTAKTKAGHYELVSTWHPSGTLDQPPIQWTLEQVPLRSDGTDVNSRHAVLGTLDTKEHRIPLAWPATFWPQLASLGPECEFKGLCSWTLIDQQVDAQLGGVLEHIDLQHLVSDQFPHVLKGHATLEIDFMKVAGGILQSVSGQLSSHSGLVGQPLLNNLATELGLKTEPSERDQVVSYEQLEVRFNLDGQSLELGGNPQSGYLLVSPYGHPLLAEGNRVPRRPHDLIRALVSDSQLQVPLTRETNQLLHWLPLPSRQELAKETGARPRAVLRLDTEDDSTR